MSAIPAGYPTDQIEAITLLTNLEMPTIDDMKIMALIEAAGETFYTAAAAAVDNEEARALLLRNGQEERGHAHRLLKAIKLLSGEDWELPADADNPYVQPMDLTGMINLELLEAIQQGERDGDLSYQGWAAKMDNAEVAKIFIQNGAEETRHGERVAQVAKLLG